MDIKEILKRYPGLNQEMIKLSENLRTAIEAGLNADGCLKAANMSDPPGSSQGDRTYNAIENLFEHLEAISADLAKYASTIKMQMQEIIYIQGVVGQVWKGLNKYERYIIENRYWYEQMTWEKIADKLHYGHTVVWEIHGHVLQKMRNELEKRIKADKIL